MNPAPTAARLGLLVCHGCSLVCRPTSASEHNLCPRCGTPLHSRKPESISRTWAFLISAYILYIPANTLPVMESQSLFNSQNDTILSGVVFLWQTGSWPLALVVFIASVTVPLAKLFALTWLVFSVQRGSTSRPRERSRLFRLVEFVGRWSMLDIFVITILVGLVQLQPLMAITAGPGALAFGAVVVLTMFAAMSFDPRLIWDPVEDEVEDENE